MHRSNGDLSTAVPSRRHYRHFIVTAIVVAFTLYAAAWIWAVNGRMWFLDAEYPMWVANADMSRICAHGDITILGDSRAKAGLIPDLIGPNVTNFALGGGTPIEAYYLVEQFLKCANPPKEVIVSFSPTHFIDDQLYWQRSVLFGRFSLGEMEQIRRASWKLNDPLIYSAAPLGAIANWIRNLSYAVSMPSYYFPAMTNAMFFMRKRRNDEIYQTVIDNRGQYFFGTGQGVDWWADDNAWIVKFKPSPLLHAYFTSAMSSLRSKGIRVWFVGMPLNVRTLQAMRPKVREDLRTYLEAFENPGSFHVLVDVLSSFPSEYFGDREHLNQKGASLWSEHIATQLRRRGVDGALLTNSEH